MRIVYLSGAYVPSRRARSVHAMRMCAALARAGHDVTLVAQGCRRREEPGVADPHRFYGVSPRFEILWPPRPAFKGGGLVYQWGLGRELRRRRDGVDLVYARDPWGAERARRLELPILFEAHGPPAGPFARRLFGALVRSPHLRRVVLISAALRSLLEEDGLLAPEVPVVVAHDGADAPADGADDGRIPASLADRSRLQVGYVGHLYPGRGVELIAGLAAAIPDCCFHLVGGRRDDVERWRRRELPPNLFFHGFVPPGELAAWYAATDILLMPYQRRVIVAGGKSDTAAWMSPMKMFEYMAAGKPIVSSDLPVLREVLEHGRNALLAPPDRPAAWREALGRLAGDADLRRRLGEAARRDLLAHYTWDQRARHVLRDL